MERAKQALHELIPFIISAAEVASEKCGCLPEDILLATIDLLEKRKRPLNNGKCNGQGLEPEEVVCNCPPLCSKCMSLHRHDRPCR
jgi:hypothetical protein